MGRARRTGVSSRVRRGRGERHPWTAPNGEVVDLPVVVDILELDDDRTVVWKVEATVDLCDDVPALVRMQFDAARGIDTEVVQREFRWATPLEIVSVTVPELLSVGIDPFTYDYPVAGYPTAALVERSAPTRLTDEFLTEIAHRYVRLGRGYAATIARQRNVSPRTVVSWIEKARERGILSATTPGAVGGSVVHEGRITS
jgi:hypothetical protein